MCIVLGTTSHISVHKCACTFPRKLQLILDGVANLTEM